MSSFEDDDGFIIGKTLAPPEQHSIIFEGYLEKKSPKSLALFVCFSAIILVFSFIILVTGFIALRSLLTPTVSTLYCDFGTQFPAELVPSHSYFHLPLISLSPLHPITFSQRLLTPFTWHLKKWQDRYVRLTREALFYYKKKDQALKDFLGAIPLFAIDRISNDKTSGKANRMDIILEKQYGRTFSFIAKTPLEINTWISMLLSTTEESKRSLTQAQRIANEHGSSKIWKAVKDDKKRELDGIPKINTPANQARIADRVARQQMESYMQFIKPLYPPLNPTPRVNVFENLSVLAQSLFGDFRVETCEQSTELGSVYLLGNQHYNTTHESYLLRSFPLHDGSQFLTQATDSMTTSIELSEFPLFPRFIHQGETNDFTYTIHHPPLRNSHDSLFAWLPNLPTFPQHIVAYIAAHVLLGLEFFHARGIQFPTLSPETIYFDATGRVRICDLFLNSNPTLLSTIPEYSTPEALSQQIQLSKSGPTPNQTILVPPPNSDYWRFGVFLYEISTGLPPFRPSPIHESDPDYGITPAGLLLYKEDIYAEMMEFNKTGQLNFPESVSPDLKDLILSLLQVDESKRVPDQSKIRSHRFFATQLLHLNAVIPKPPGSPNFNLWDLNHLLTSPRPQWITQNVVEALAKSPLTPSNLTFKPCPKPVQRLSVNISQIRFLPREFSQRLVCNVCVEGETQRTQMGTQITPDYVLYESDPLTFDIINSTETTSPGSEVVIELTTLVPQQQAGKREANVTSSKASFVGLVSLSLASIRASRYLKSWMTIFDQHGSCLGEMEVEFKWEVEHIDLNQQVLSQLTSSSVHFAQQFGKPSVPQGGNHDRKLHSLVLDPSVLAVSEQEIAAMNGEKLANNNLGNLNTISMPNLNINTANSGQGWGTLKLSSQTPNLGASTPTVMQLQSGAYTPPGGMTSSAALQQMQCPSTPIIGTLASNTIPTPSYMSQPGGRASRAGLFISPTFAPSAHSTPIQTLTATMEEAPPLPPLPPSMSSDAIQLQMEHSPGPQLSPLQLSCLRLAPEQPTSAPAPPTPPTPPTPPPGPPLAPEPDLEPPPPMPPLTPRSTQPEPPPPAPADPNSPPAPSDESSDPPPAPAELSDPSDPTPPPPAPTEPTPPPTPRPSPPPSPLPSLLPAPLPHQQPDFTPPFQPLQLSRSSTSSVSTPSLRLSRAASTSSTSQASQLQQLIRSGGVSANSSSRQQPVTPAATTPLSIHGDRPRQQQQQQEQEPSQQQPSQQQQPPPAPSPISSTSPAPQITPLIFSNNGNLLQAAPLTPPSSPSCSARTIDSVPLSLPTPPASSCGSFVYEDESDEEVAVQTQNSPPPPHDEPPPPDVTSSPPSDIQSSPPPPEDEPILPDDIVQNWKIAKSPQGEKYFFNTVTKKTSWEPPQCLVDYAAKQKNK